VSHSTEFISTLGISPLTAVDSYRVTNNNGNVVTQTITIGATVMSQSYGYDAVNRLTSATETGAWTQTYDYDRYGNRV